MSRLQVFEKWDGVGWVVYKSALELWREFYYNALYRSKGPPGWISFLKTRQYKYRENDAEDVWNMYEKPQLVPKNLHCLGESDFILQFINVLGKGLYGVVLLVDVLDQESYKPVDRLALKITKKDLSFENEYLVMQYLNNKLLATDYCPNILALNKRWTCSNLPPQLGKWNLQKYSGGFGVGWGGQWGYLLMKYAEHGNADRYFRNIIISPDLLQRIAFQLFYTYAALRKVGVQHRDVHTDNFVFGKQPPGGIAYTTDFLHNGYFDVFNTSSVPVIYPLDFNRSKIIEERKNMIVSKFATNAMFTAPELFFVHEDEPVYYHYESELFSVGVLILYMALSNRHPWYKSEIVPDEYVEDFLNMPAIQPGSGVLATYFPYFPDNKKRTRDKRILIARGLWWMVRKLGLPTNREISGVERSPVYRVIAKYKDTARFASVDKAPLWNHPSIKSHLRPVLEIMKKVMSWDYAKRPGYVDILRSFYFKEFVKYGSGSERKLYRLPI